jgi:sugar lactone lactonase YvrE
MHRISTTRAAWTLGACALALSLSASHADDDSAPTNDLPNPYRSIAPWGKLPEGETWGAFNSVAVDNDGVSLWVATRCGANPNIPPGASPYQYDSCAGSTVAPVMKLDANGHVVKRFGAGLFVFPHKIVVDPDGNLWIVDGRTLNERERKAYPDEPPKGHVVVKMSPDGRVLMTLGTPGVAGTPPQALNEPCSVAIGPNGDIFVSEGHSGQYAEAGPDNVARISRFTRDGKFLRAFGKWGTGPGEFRTPHDIAIDPQGRLLVADRGNMRIQFLDLDGSYLGEWKQFGRPSGLAIRDGLLYVADSESNGIKEATHPGWKRGIRIGTLADGKVTARIPDPLEMKGTSAAEGIAVDAKGNVYGGEVGPRRLARHEPH